MTTSSSSRSVVVAVLLVCLLSFACASNASKKTIPQSTLSGAAYPAWAHYHWVWLASFAANQSSLTQLFDDYRARNIPVGAINVDSRWSTGINNFIWDTTKYPNSTAMIANFHNKGARVICWTTSMVDTDSSNWEEGKKNHYFLNNGQTRKWWHGDGSQIDYTNPAAVEWWHNQLAGPLKQGLDGWKLDGTDPYAASLIPYPHGKGGRITEREFADMYYGDYFNFSRTINPDSLVMSRPVDSYGPLYWSFSPHYVMYSGWVGDQDPTFFGLQNALRNMFHSAWRNYANFGSDIGGYRTGSGPLGRTKELFTRWFQMGSVVPLMENGGNKEHRPWKFDSNNATLDTYRVFVALHYELVPYFLNAGTTAMEKGISVMKPMANETIETPDSWNYLLWTDIFVAPIVDNVTTIDISFPVGSNWIDYWNTSRVYTGGSTVSLTYPLSSFPIFQRQGSIIPLQVNNSLVGHGDEHCSNYVTLHAHPTHGSESAIIREWRGITQEITYEHDSDSLTLTATAHSRKLLLHAFDIGVVTKVVDTLSNTELTKHSTWFEFQSCVTGCWLQQSLHDVWVKLPEGSQGSQVRLSL